MAEYCYFNVQIINEKTNKPLESAKDYLVNLKTYVKENYYGLYESIDLNDPITIGMMGGFSIEGFCNHEKTMKALSKQIPKDCYLKVENSSDYECDEGEYEDGEDPNSFETHCWKNGKHI